MRLYCAAAAVLVWLSCSPQAAAQGSQPSADFVWAAACKDCHAPQYAAWASSKHAHAITRLSNEERQGVKCVGCHVTGATTLAADNVNANVQCEECHGPGRAHLQGDPEAITRKPNERVCVRCHSEASPKFKYFSYAAMSRLVHVTRK